MVSALILPLFFINMQADAESNRTYYISGYTINAGINPDGSADMEERLTYNFNGQFNGALVDIDFSLTGGLVNQKVYVIKNDTLEEWTLNPSDSLDYSGQPGSYNFVKEGTLAHFKIFEPSQNEEKTFILKYKMLDAVTKFNDTAEFNRKLIGTGWQTRLDNIYIKITLPEGALKEEIKVFGHGPLIGESTILDARNVEFKVASVLPGTFVETRVLFPVKLVSQSKNVVAKDALPDIMASEGKLAEEANNQREIARQQVKEQKEAAQKMAQLITKLQSIGNIAALILFLIWFPLIIYIYIKYDKELKHNFSARYYRELPGDYTPAEMSILLSMGSVQSRDIMATLMDLIRKRQLVLNVNKVYKQGLFGSKEVNEYLITLNSDAPNMELKKHEHFLISWFLGKIGSGSTVTLDEIKVYVRSRYNALQFRSDYNKWEKLAKEEAAKNKFIDETSGKGRLIGILSGVLYFILSMGMAVLMLAPVAALPAIQGIFLIFFSIRIRRRTAYGNEQHAMWHAFKNFLKGFSSLDKAEIPSIVLWEYYLIYAISLGVAKEVIKQLPLVFNDNDLNNNHLTYMHGATYGYFAGFTTMFDDTIHTVEGALTTANAVANSTNSSGSGRGGGFSGGSSGGGGGGGGGGAF